MTKPNHAPKKRPQPRPIFFTQAAKDITLKQVEKALIEIGNKYPDATKYGFDYNYRRDDGKPVDIIKEEGGLKFLLAVRHCVDWLHHFNLIKTKRKTNYTHRTAYSYKHSVEHWINNVKNKGIGGEHIPYVPMMAFCAACWIVGIPETSRYGDNPVYPLSKRWADRADYSHERNPLRAFNWYGFDRAAANADTLAEWVAQRGKTDLLELETAPDCEWWRALDFNDRAAAVDILRRDDTRVAVLGDVGDRLALFRRYGSGKAA